MKISTNKKILALLSIFCTIGFADLKIQNIEIKNLKELDKKYVEQLLPIRIGDKFSNKELTEIYKTLKSDNAIQDVVLSPKVEDNNVTIGISVDELPNAKDIVERDEAIKKAKQKTELIIENVKIEGLNNTEKEEIDKLLSTDLLKKGEFFVPYNVEVIKGRLFATGYFQNVDSEVIRNGKNKSVDIVFKVKENPVVRSLSISGSRMFLEKDLIDASEIQIGKVLDSNKLNPETMPLLAKYHKLGVVAARVKDIQVTPNGDVSIELTEGKVGNISFTKVVQRKDNERRTSSKADLKTQDFVFNRAMVLERGDTLTKDKIDNSLRELQRTGLFTSIVPDIKPSATNPDILDIDFQVAERSTTSLNASGTYSTTDGIVGSLTLKDANFLGRAQEMSLNVDVSTHGNLNFSANFFDPWIRGTDRVQAGFNSTVSRKIILSKAELKKIQTDTIPKETDLVKKAKLVGQTLNKANISYSYNVSANVGKGLNKNFYINIKPQIRGEYSYNHNGDKLDDYTLFSISPTLAYDTRDNSFIPKKGAYLQLTNELGYIFRDTSKSYRPKTNGLLESDYEYVLNENKTGIYNKIEGDIRLYHPVYKDVNSMAYRLVIGYATDLAKQTFNSGDGTFFRGQPNTVSGNEKFVISIENRTYISQYVQGVIFFDFGNIYNSADRKEAWQLSTPLNNRKGLKISFGAGVRINTPLGVIRLDYGWPLEKSKYTNKFKPSSGNITFGFGQTF